VALLRLEGESPEVVSTFEQGLQTTSEETRTAAVARLSELGPGFPKTTILLAEALRDPDFHNRLTALDSLSRLGSNAISVLPAITALTNDRNSRVRKAATNAVEAVQSSLPSGVNH
jgi:HEAT repeat protein